MRVFFFLFLTWRFRILPFLPNEMVIALGAQSLFFGTRSGISFQKILIYANRMKNLSKCVLGPAPTPPMYPRLEA